MTDIKKCFDIIGGDTVSVVGAGGKTSLIFYLANKVEGKVIVTTSTKMKYPNDYRVIIDEKINFNAESEIIVTAKEVIDNKITKVNEYIFINDMIDYTFIEADGSKMKPLKGWGSHEPVIICESKKTIGIIDITTVGIEVCDDNIFRLDEFRKMTNTGEYITIDNLADIVKNEDGLFKNTVNKKIVFINKVENPKLKEYAKKLYKKIFNYVDIVVIGSIKNEYFEVLKGEHCE